MNARRFAPTRPDASVRGTILFIIALIVIGVSMHRSRNAGNKVTSRVDPIPDTSARNEHTRVDQNTTTRLGVNRNYSESTASDELNSQR